MAFHFCSVKKKKKRKKKQTKKQTNKKNAMGKSNLVINAMYWQMVIIPIKFREVGDVPLRKVFFLKGF